jgi:hypothetical protein
MKRWPLFAAIVYVVLLFAGLFVVPAAPEVTASGARLVRYFRDHGDGVRRAIDWNARVLPRRGGIAGFGSSWEGGASDFVGQGAVGHPETVQLLGG